MQNQGINKDSIDGIYSVKKYMQNKYGSITRFYKL